MVWPLTPKQMFDRIERAIGGLLEDLIQSSQFIRSSRTLVNIEARARRRAERASRRVLHALNLPAGSDVRRLESQLSRLERAIEREVQESHRFIAGQPPDERGDDS